MLGHLLVNILKFINCHVCFAIVQTGEGDACRRIKHPVIVRESLLYSDMSDVASE
jgi:hypothetical protein